MYKLNPKFQPYPHQLIGAEYVLAHNYTLNADEPGVGKTLQAVMVANATNSPTLIVCPAYLKYNWANEIHQLCAEVKNVSLFATTSDIYAAMGSEVLDDFIIINYEQIQHCEHLFRWANFVVVDEATNIKNIAARRSIFFDEFLFNHPAERLLLLTGTPIHNKITDMYNLLAMLSYDSSGTNGKNILHSFPTFESFCEHFAYKKRVQIRTPRGTITQIKYDGVRNVEELRSYLDGKFIRRRQKDVLDLPDLQHIDVVVSYKENKALLEEFEAHNEKTEKDIGVKAKVKSATLKAKFTAKYALDILEADLQVVIYSAHRDSAKLVADGIEGCAYIDGSVDPMKRQDIVNSFQAGEIKAISATIGAGSTGFTLTASQDLIFNDKDWLPGENEQALRRIYRIGQEKRCRIHHIYGSPQDQYIGHRLTEKLLVINTVLQE